MTVLTFFIVDCDSNATGFLRNAYEGASPRARGTLNETGDKVRVQDGVCLLREGRVQPVRARLNRLCSGRDLDFKGMQRACTAIQFGRGKKEKKNAYSVSVALRMSIALGFQPGASSVPEAEEKIHVNSRVDIEVRGVSSGESSIALES